MTIKTIDFFKEVIANRIIWGAFFSWAAAQGIKIVSGLIKEKRFNFKWLMGTGGMPSAHSASVSALAAGVGLCMGFDSAVFAATAIFALIIMFDAQSVRRMSGLQAETLNQLSEDIYYNRGVKPERLRELIGHTPVEVIMGAILGILVAIIVVTG